MQNWLAVVVVAVLGLGCDTPKDVVEKNQKPGTAKLEQMRAAVKTALAKPVLTPPVLPEKLKFRGNGKDLNAFVANAEWLAVPSTDPEHKILSTTSEFYSTRNLLEGGTIYGDATDVYREYFENFLGAKYLVVLTTTSYNQGSMKSDNVFYGGYFIGTLHIVDIEKAASLGSFEVTSKSSDEVEAVKGDEASMLGYDVAKNARMNINTLLEPYSVPNQTVI